MRPVAARPRPLVIVSILIAIGLVIGAACSTPTPVGDDPTPTEAGEEAVQDRVDEPEVDAVDHVDYVDRTRQACIAGEYSSCCQIMSDEESQFLDLDYDFAEVYLRSPCLSQERSFDACTYLGIALHLQPDGRGARAQDFLRVACFGGDRDACQWLEHLGAELRGVPVDAGDDALDGDDFARGCGFRD